MQEGGAKQQRDIVRVGRRYVDVRCPFRYCSKGR